MDKTIILILAVASIIIISGCIQDSGSPYRSSEDKNNSDFCTNDYYTTKYVSYSLAGTEDKNTTGIGLTPESTLLLSSRILKNGNSALEKIADLNCITYFGMLEGAYLSDNPTVKETWGCGSGLDCDSPAMNLYYQFYEDFFDNTHNFEFSSSSTNSNNCTITLDTCCYGFYEGDHTQTNETDTVSINGQEIGTTEDPFCNEWCDCTIKEYDDKTFCINPEDARFSLTKNNLNLQTNNDLEIVSGHSHGVSSIDIECLDPSLASLLPLSKLTKLEYLNLFGAKIFDLTPLSDLTNLKHLNLKYTNVSDISPVSNLTNMVYLNLFGTKVSNLAPISNFTNLEYLDLGNTKVSNFSQLSNLTNLKYLDLGNTRGRDVSSLSKLTKLEHLDLFTIKFSDISSLSGLTNLKYLNLAFTEITDISILSSFTKLEQLDLFKVNVSDISSLSNLTNLKSLSLGYIPVSDISLLYNLTNLELLFLDGSGLSDADCQTLKDKLPNTLITC